MDFLVLFWLLPVMLIGLSLLTALVVCKLID